MLSLQDVFQEEVYSFVERILKEREDTVFSRKKD